MQSYYQKAPIKKILTNETNLASFGNVSSIATGNALIVPKNMAGHKATIKDIAKRARAGVSSISRVLNDHPDVSQKMRDKVQAIVKELNYRPHSRARQLVRNTAETICFVMSNREVINPFHSHILIGVEQYARSLSRNLIFMRFDYPADIPAGRMVLPPLIWERGTVDGLILAGTNYPNFVKAIKNLGVPFVLLGNNLIGQIRSTDIDSVWFDSKGGAYQATEYLIELGHRHIWYFAELQLPWYRYCYQGYVKAMRRHGLQPRRLEVKRRGSLFEYGLEAVDEILKLRGGLSALVAGDDQIALGVLSGLTENGIKIPEDISLIGSDDIEEIQYFQPSLTTVRVPKEKVGEELANLLFERLEKPNREPTTRIVPTELVIRQSCAAPKQRLATKRI